MRKKLFYILFIFVTVIIFGKSIENELNVAIINSEQNIEQSEELKYKAFVLGDEHGRIFYSENARKKYPLASVTKIMTLLLTYDALYNGDIKLSDTLTVTNEMVNMGGSKLWMKKGSKITVEDLIKATAIYSANNAAYGLAIIVGGNVDNFVKMMNEKARKLGIGDEIEYNTPCGLPPHMTGRGMDIGSAFGVYKLSLEALNYKEYIEIASQKEASLSYLGRYRIKNRNELLDTEGIYGIKTGHLDDWYNIAIASKNKIDSISVVLGSPTQEDRDKKVLSGIEKFNEEYKKIKFLDKTTPVGAISVLDGDIKKVEFFSNKNFEYIVKKSDKIKFLIYRKEKAEAPINAGDSVGRYEITLNGKIINSGKLIVKDKVEKN